MTKIANRNSITELIDHKLTLLELFYTHRGGAWCLVCFVLRRAAIVAIERVIHPICYP